MFLRCLSLGLIALFALGAARSAEFNFPDPYAGKKKVLIIGDIHTGAQIAHDAVSHAVNSSRAVGHVA